MNIETISNNVVKVLFEKLLRENVDLDDIPVDCGKFSSIYNGVPHYQRYEYFGNCVNSVSSVFGDTTAMSRFVNSCSIVGNKESVLQRIQDGDRKIPKDLINVLNHNGDIVIGINDREKIMFIYSEETDIHYFFDCF